MAIYKKALRDNGVKVISATELIPDSPEGKLFLAVIEGFNEYFSEDLKQKVNRGLRESWLKGNATGGKDIFGWDLKDAHLSVEEIEKFLLSKVFEDPDDIKVRKLLVNTFVREVIWYGDHMVITYNFQERFSTERFSKSYVEDIEKQVGECSRSASSFPLSSYKVTQSAPNPSKRNILCFEGFFYTAY